MISFQERVVLGLGVCLHCNDTSHANERDNERDVLDYKDNDEIMDEFMPEFKDINEESMTIASFLFADQKQTDEDGEGEGRSYLSEETTMDIDDITKEKKEFLYAEGF